MVSENDILQSGIFDFPVFPLAENIAGQGSGDNLKNILVCIADNNDPGLMGFLQKVMAAVKIDLPKDAFTLFLKPGQKFIFSDLANTHQFQKAIFFGLKPTDAGLNLNIQKYTPLKYNGKTFLFSDLLSEVQNKPALKRPLWEALKVVF
ncbi:MAG TPA: hypothetical protein ENJ95_04075 [Bacteroidetes bacterium]|nr:hypothetical protein [Bacteroidota bacterium]